MKRCLWLMVLLVVLPWQLARADADTLRPDGDGHYEEWLAYETTLDKYTRVDEAVADDADYVYESSVDDTISFTLEAFSGSGTIDSVVLHYRGEEGSGAAAGHMAEITPLLRLDATDSFGTPNAIDSSVVAEFSEAISRPGGGSWVTADMADLEVGVLASDFYDAGIGSPWAKVTQIWVVVWYTITSTPQVIMVQ